MITHLKGILVEATPLRAVIEIGGIGYEVHIPVTTAEQLPACGSEVTLHTRVVYREDSQTLYGFSDKETRELFELLVEKVSGIGPKIALSVLSKMSIQSLRQAITMGDAPLLAKCPGIGRKTAERIVIELKDKAFSGGTLLSGGASGSSSAMAAQPASPSSDALAALIALGYKAADADSRVRKAIAALDESATTEQIIRKALGN